MAARHFAAIAFVLILTITGIAYQTFPVNAEGEVTGSVPTSGVGIVLWGGGPPSAVAPAVASKGCTLQSFWVASSGRLDGYVAGAPGFVNDAFVARFPGGTVPPQTPLVLVCTAGASIPTPAATFPAGTYYRLPGVSAPEATLTRVEGALPSRVVLPPGGFDLRGQTLVYADESRVTLVAVDGSSSAVQVDGLYALARPSLSPDGTRVAVQATRTPVGAGQPVNLSIFVIDLKTKTFVELPGTVENEESPEWFPQGDRVLYSSFSPTAGVNLHIYDVAAQREVLTLRDAGALHMAVSPDGQRILDMWRFRIYDSTTGAVQADLLAGVRASLTAAGLAMDPVHNGRDGRGSFPLDGAFSPDGRSIVFDGAVVQGGRSGLMLFTVGVDGTGFRAVSGLIETDAAFTNNFNYSPLNPLWR